MKRGGGRDDEGRKGGEEEAGTCMPMMKRLLSLKHPPRLLTWFHSQSMVL